MTSAVRTPDGGGYWNLFANGATANFGDAGVFGSPAGQMEASTRRLPSSLPPTAPGTRLRQQTVQSPTTATLLTTGPCWTRLNGSIIVATG